PQRQHPELHGLPLLSAGRTNHDGDADELGRRYSRHVADDAGHRTDRQPEPPLDRTTKAVASMPPYVERERSAPSHEPRSSAIPPKMILILILREPLPTPIPINTTPELFPNSPLKPSCRISKCESGRQLNRFNVLTKGLGPRSNIGGNSGGLSYGGR